MKNNIYLASNDFHKPYTFILTKITVYSFEEFLYHIFHYPKSFYDFDTVVFKNFVKENILNIDEDVVNIVEKNLSAFDKMINIVLKYEHLYNAEELSNFQINIFEYSKKEEEELFKEVGYDLLKIGEYFKAKEIYSTFVNKYIDCNVFNNYSYACIKTGFIDEAKTYLHKACNMFQEPNVFYNYIKLLLQENDIKKAYETVALLNSKEHKNFQRFLTALIEVKEGDYGKALESFENILNNEYTEQYFNHYINLLVKLNKIDIALEQVEKYLSKEDVKYYITKANIYKGDGQIVEAITSLEEGLKGTKNLDKSIEMYTLISKFYRENYDFKKATQYIRKALAMKNSGMNRQLLLELALINKSNGNMNSYKDAMEKLVNIYVKAY